MTLSGKQRRHLRALAHALAPLAQIGKDGIGERQVAAVAQALLDHELVKVKIIDTAPIDRHEAAAQLAAQTGAHVAQVLGNIVLLYKPHPDEPVIVLP